MDVGLVETVFRMICMRIKIDFGIINGEVIELKEPIELVIREATEDDFFEIFGYDGRFKYIGEYSIDDGAIVVVVGWGDTFGKVVDNAIINLEEQYLFYAKNIFGFVRESDYFKRVHETLIRIVGDIEV